MQGLYALNAAGGEWVEVEPELYGLLEQLQAWGAGETFNPALGGVIDVWAQAREAGVLPTGRLWKPRPCTPIFPRWSSRTAGRV